MTIVAAFDHAAAGYDAAADIQAIAAKTLIARASAAQPRTVLDIGCGTGMVSAMARALWPQAAITAVDAAPSMLAAARAKVPDAEFLQADASTLALEQRYDLVLSSMVLHWLGDPAAVLARWQALVAPGGALHIAVPVAGSLDEWGTHCAGLGLTARLWPFPKPEIIGGDVLRHTIQYSDARRFLQVMKKTGAASGNPAQAGLSPVALRRALKAAPKPFTASFLIAYR